MTHTQRKTSFVFFASIEKEHVTDGFFSVTFSFSLRFIFDDIDRTLSDLQQKKDGS